LVQKKTETAYQAVDVLAWFNRADVWRKPDRGQALLNLAGKIGLNVSILAAAMRNAQALNTAEIIAGVEAQDRSNGERIGNAFEAARLAAITAALQS
jgi:tRNA nucleotidyltransferase (CCA-adding enzyme)